MTLLDAFAESRNIPALKLAAKVGIAKVIETAHRFGDYEQHPGVSAGGDRVGGYHAGGAGGGLQRVSERRHSD
jgi:membrane peptidoglycan carboxypeptidase